MMAAWTVHYWGDDGLRDKAVAAESRAAALALAGVPAPRVLKVTRRWWLSDAVVWLKPPVKIQALFLARALALFTAGNAALVNDLISSLPELRRLAKKRPDALRDDLELSTKIQRLEFSPEIVAIIEAGEKTGRLTQAIETALVYLRRNIEIGQKSSKQFTFGVLLVVVSLSLFFVLPLLLAEPIEMLRGLRDVQVNLTFATYVLLFIKTAVADYWGLLAAGAVAAVTAAWRFRRALSHVPPFGAFLNLEKTKRSISFLVVWRAFRVAEVPLEEQKATLTASIGPTAAAHVFDGLKRGESLSGTLDRRFFSPILTLAAGDLSQIGAETFLKVAETLLTSLHEEQRAGAARVSAIMYAFGVVVTIAIVSLIAFGLIFPIMSTSAGGI